MSNPRDLSIPNKALLPIRMEESNSAILIIDFQDRLVKAINSKDQILLNIEKVINAGNILNVPLFFTEQNPEKLGPTVDLIRPKQKQNTYSKMNFSCASCKQLMETLVEKEIENILLCGVETHICVQQTALDLISKGLNIFIAIDAVGSRNKIDHEVAIRRLENSGVVISTSESIIFEWCKNAERLEFKKISELIKKVKS